MGSGQAHVTRVAYFTSQSSGKPAPRCHPEEPSSVIPRSEATRDLLSIAVTATALLETSDATPCSSPHATAAERSRR